MNVTSLARIVSLAWSVLATAQHALAAPPQPSTFSIVAADPESGEVGVAVASRFFSVGSVVPYGAAEVGAIATQANANASYGPLAIELLARGASPDEVVQIMTRQDEGRDTRQFGVVTATGGSATYTGDKCNAWAGGRRGPGYAVQGNILASEAVVIAMEKAFLETSGKPLVDRLYAALAAGDAAGGDARGRQSAALMVWRARGGYGGFTDRAVDIRVDDHAEPIKELGRLAGMSLALDWWNRGWTLFTEKKYAEALIWQEKASQKAQGMRSMEAEVLYDLAVIRLAAGDKDGSWQALRSALGKNPKLEKQASADPDLEALRPFPKR